MLFFSVLLSKTTIGAQPILDVKLTVRFYQLAPLFWASLQDSQFNMLEIRACPALYKAVD